MVRAALGNGGHNVVAVPGEVREVRAVARRPFPERWSREELQALRATPWAWTCPEEVAAERVAVIPHAPAVGARPVGPVPKGQVAPMRVEITLAMLEEYGYTARCWRCTLLRAGRPRAH